MKYEGTVYGKVNGRYIVLTETVKQLEDKNKELIKEVEELKSEIKSIYKAISRAEDLGKNIKWE